jgi:transcriptional regulator with XRE-family HTH domain
MRSTTIKQIRNSKGLTLSELSEKTGFSPGYLNHIENGRRLLPQSLIPTLAKALNVPKDTLERIAQQGDNAAEYKESWIGHIKIQGYPLAEAFSHHLLSKGRIDLNNQGALKRELIEFVKQNITHSLIAELQSNKQLLSLFIEQVNQTIRNK